MPPKSKWYNINKVGFSPDKVHYPGILDVAFPSSGFTRIKVNMETITLALKELRPIVILSSSVTDYGD